MFKIPAWKNFDEFESLVTMDEMTHLLEIVRNNEDRHYRFLAALQGIDLDKEEQASGTTFEDVRSRVAAKQQGMSQEAYEFRELGIAMVEE